MKYLITLQHIYTGELFTMFREFKGPLPTEVELHDLIYGPKVDDNGNHIPGTERLVNAVICMQKLGEDSDYEVTKGVEFG